MIDKIKLIINNIHFKLLMFILRPQIRQKNKKKPLVQLKNLKDIGLRGISLGKNPHSKKLFF